MFVASHPLKDLRHQECCEAVRLLYFSPELPEDSISQSGSSSLFHSIATRFPDLKASTE
jgi:hypothetical protein